MKGNLLLAHRSFVGLVLSTTFLGLVSPNPEGERYQRGAIGAKRPDCGHPGRLPGPGVNDRPNRATNDRRNGATCKRPKRGLGDPIKFAFFTPFHSLDFDVFGVIDSWIFGVGCGARKVFPSKRTV